VLYQDTIALLEVVNHTVVQHRDRARIEVDVLLQESEPHLVLQDIPEVVEHGLVLTEAQAAVHVRINRIETRPQEVVAIDHQVAEVRVLEVAVIEVQEVVQEALEEASEAQGAVLEVQEASEVLEVLPVRPAQDLLDQEVEVDDSKLQIIKKTY